MTDYTKISDEELFSLYEHFSEQYNLAADEIVNRLMAEPTFDAKYGDFKKMEDRMRGTKQ